MDKPKWFMDLADGVEEYEQFAYHKVQRCCMECNSNMAYYYCDDCTLTLCYRCCDAIHLVAEYNCHRIRRLTELDVKEIFVPNQDTEFRDTRFDEFNHIYASEVIPSRATDAPLINLPSTKTSSMTKFQVGDIVLFCSLDITEHPDSLAVQVIRSNRQYCGTIVQTQQRQTQQNMFLYRVMWARGIQKLSSRYFQANITFYDGHWPIEVGQYTVQWHAIRAVAVAEDVATKLWLREVYAGREVNTIFSTEEEVKELMEHIHVAIEEAQILHDPIKSNEVFIEKLVAGKCNAPTMSNDTKTTIFCRQKAYHIPWRPHERTKYLLLHEEDMQTHADAQPKLMKRIILHMLRCYLVYSMNRWKRRIQVEKERERRALENDAAYCIQKAVLAYLDRHNAKRKSLFLQMKAANILLPKLELKKVAVQAVVKEKSPEKVQPAKPKISLLERQQYTKSAKDLALFCRRRNAMAFRCIRRLEKKYIENCRFAIKKWKHHTSPTLDIESWHPAIGVVLPRLPKLWCSISNTGALIIEDIVRFAQFKSVHRGPTDCSNWVIKGRLLVGAYPTGQAFRDNKKVVARSDSIASLILQRISTFVCLMTKDELMKHEKQAGDPLAYQGRINDRKHVLETEFGNVLRAQTNSHTAAVKALEAHKDKRQKAIEDGVVQSIADNEEYFETIKQIEQRLELAIEKKHIANELMSKIRPIHQFHCPILRNTAGTPELIESYAQQIEERLRNNENVYIFSSDGHGRVGMMAAILLARLYGITSRESLTRIQRCHDAMALVDKKGALPISSPQSMVQIRMVHQLVSVSSDVIYAELATNTVDKDDDIPVPHRLVRKQQRGIPVKHAKSSGFMVEPLPSSDARIEASELYKKQIRLGKREATSYALRVARSQEDNERKNMRCEDSK